MSEILALLQNIAPLLNSSTFNQMSHVVFGMLVISDRITMLGISRWTLKGGSYRTVQRFYSTKLSWKNIHWMLFKSCHLKHGDEYIIAGDEVVVSKSGKKTFGIDRFFSGIQQQTILGISFFTFSLVNVREEHSYPIKTTQILKSPEEKANTKAKAEAKKVKKTVEKKKPGRPKGSKNKKKNEVQLNPELLRIQESLQTLLATIGNTLALTYLVMDGHFGNYPSAFMVTNEKLHLISKLRHDASLYSKYDGEYSGRGPKKKYGSKIDIDNIDEKYLKESSTVGTISTNIYQGQLYNKMFNAPLNVVIIVKTNLSTDAKAHAILFSTDLEQQYDKIIKFYQLRFQIEFNFRDAKQYWGLEDFMNTKETAVTNAANMSFFMVNFSRALLQPFREENPDKSILDLKSYYRGYRYVSETIKMLPEKPDTILLAEIFRQIAQLGAIHPASTCT